MNKKENFFSKIGQSKTKTNWKEVAELVRKKLRLEQLEDA
jgi:hypothetical protein